MHMIDVAWIESLRKDFLVLLKNLPRVKDYATARRLREAIGVYRRRFEEIFYDQFLNRDFKYESGLDEGTQKWLDKELRTTSWTFVSELSSMPLYDADEYVSEGRQFARYESDAPKWKARLQRKAQVFWKAAKDFLDYYARTKGKPGFEVRVPNVDTTELEGFKLVMRRS